MRQIKIPSKIVQFFFSNFNRKILHFTIENTRFKTNGKRPHYQILEMLGAFDTDKGVEAAGHRGYYLTGPGVILNQALISYGLAFLHNKGCRKNSFI